MSQPPRPPPPDFPDPRFPGYLPMAPVPMHPQIPMGPLNPMHQLRRMHPLMNLDTKPPVSNQQNSAYPHHASPNEPVVYPNPQKISHDFANVPGSHVICCEKGASSIYAIFKNKKADEAEKKILAEALKIEHFAHLNFIIQMGVARGLKPGTVITGSRIGGDGNCVYGNFEYLFCTQHFEGGIEPKMRYFALQYTDILNSRVNLFMEFDLEDRLPLWTWRDAIRMGPEHECLIISTPLTYRCYKHRDFNPLHVFILQYHAAGQPYPADLSMPPGLVDCDNPSDPAGLISYIDEQLGPAELPDTDELLAPSKMIYFDEVLGNSEMLYFDELLGPYEKLYIY